LSRDETTNKIQYNIEKEVLRHNQWNPKLWSGAIRGIQNASTMQ